MILEKVMEKVKEIEVMFTGFPSFTMKIRADEDLWKSISVCTEGELVCKAI